MLRRSLVIAGCLAGLASAPACTDGADSTAPGATPPAAPAPTKVDPPMPARDPLALAELEAEALACDGAAVAAGFVARSLTQLADDPEAGPSTRLLAAWEAGRRFTPAGTLDPAAVATLDAALTGVLGQAPPRWWIEQLASATRLEPAPDGSAQVAAYDVGFTDGGDRRGPLQPLAHLWIRPEAARVLSLADGALAYDLSSGRLDLGPAPTDPGVTLELARARAGTTVYLASFDRGAGGFRFPLRAVTREGVAWQAEVCGPDRKILGGLGYLIVEIVVLEPASAAAPGQMAVSAGPTGIAVFSGETHGVALDVFDPETGARTLAWSSELWFTR